MNEHGRGASTERVRHQFRMLHQLGTFVMPNAWDAGSARILAALGAGAIGTTSAGHAATLGRADQHVTLEELSAHATELVAAVDVPISVDAERCFADTPDGVATTVAQLATSGASGVSIEDYHPTAGIDPIDVATRRVAAAARISQAHGMVLTARADAHLYGPADLDDTIRRLNAYRDAGADCVYAPGLLALDDITAVVDQVDAPVNVLALPGTPSIAELTDAGVRRISTGSTLILAAYGALEQSARALLDEGRHPVPSLSDELRQSAFLAMAPSDV